MSEPFVYGSVCSGIEAATVAWHPLGWHPAFFAEIDRFPAAVLAHRFPEIPNRGDFTQIGADAGPVDLLVGGTPCQSFSVAGLRGGLDDERGNLALEFLRLAGRTRPRWLVWENVPGVLSSNGGRDFGAFLGGLVELGYGFAYRVLDAQFFGVPQRRRRVFVVGCLGDWRGAVAVLFERACLSGHPAPGREAGADIAAFTPGRIGGYREGVGTLRANGGDIGPGSESLIAHTLRGEGFDGSEDGCGRGTPLVPVAFGWNKSTSQTMQISETTDALQASPTSNPAVAYQCHGTNVGPMGTLRSGNGTETGGVPFTFDERQITSNANRTRVAPGMPHGTLHSQPHAVCTTAAVRRLTPRECERLQGFPDDWTLVPYRGKPAADGPRYKAIGNSMAVPVMAWIGRRIQAVNAILARGVA